MALTEKQLAFAKEYIVDFNGTRAAIAAGYSEKTAAVTASENLRKPNIQAAIGQALHERNERTKIDQDYVLLRLAQVDQMDVLDILDDDGNLKPVKDWPKVWRQFISGIEVTEMFEGRGAERAVVGVLKKVKWPDKLKNLELLGRHVDVQAWRDKVDHGLDDETKQSLQDIARALDGTSKGLPNG